MARSSPVNPGDIFLHYKYKFPKGEPKDKLFIILNDYTQDGSSVCLALITTSQERHFPNVLAGCNKGKRVFVIPKDKESFPKDTYLLMIPVYPFPEGSFIKAAISGEIK